MNRLHSQREERILSQNLSEFPRYACRVSSSSAMRQWHFPLSVQRQDKEKEEAVSKRKRIKEKEEGSHLYSISVQVSAPKLLLMCLVPLMSTHLSAVPCCSRRGTAEALSLWRIFSRPEKDSKVLLKVAAVASFIQPL